MNIEKLNDIIKSVKDDLADGLIQTDVWSTSDGKVVASFNPQSKSYDLLDQMIKRINEALKDANFPLLRHYLLKHSEGDRIIMTIFLGEYTWGLSIDTHKTQLGLFLNVILPETMDSIKQALAA